jgi:hypothetical protein
MESIVKMLDAIMGCACVDHVTKMRAGFLKNRIEGTDPLGDIFEMFRKR